MKILLTDIHHGNGGGHATYILSLLRGLSSDHSLTVSAPCAGRLYRAASAVGRARVLPGLFTSRPWPLAMEVAELRRFLHREQFDLVHVNGSADHRHVMLARMGLPRPPRIVWTKHNVHPVTSLGHRLRARFGTDAAVAVSAYVQQMLSRTDYTLRPIHLVRNGIDIDHFKPYDEQRRWRVRHALLGPVGRDALVLGSTGGTDLDKGWLDLVRAVAQLGAEEQRRIHIIVAGDKPRPEDCSRLMPQGFKANLVFPGLLDDVRDVLGASDAGFVLSHKEALSYACREAMAMGLPVLVSDAGGLPENLEHDVHGWIVPKNSPRDIAAVVRQMLHAPMLLRQRGQAARQRAGCEFCIVRFADRMEQVYRSVVK